MRINNNHLVIEMPAPKAVTAVSSPKRTNKPASTVVQPAEDRVALAGEARVAELKRRYQDGTYKVDPLEVSSKIIDRHID